MFGLSLAVYFFNLQYFIKKQFKYEAKEALGNQTQFKDAQKGFLPNTYIENNPADKARNNLELYKKPETLTLQAELEELAKNRLTGLQIHGKPAGLKNDAGELEFDNGQQDEGSKVWEPLMGKDSREDIQDSYNPYAGKKQNSYVNPQGRNPFFHENQVPRGLGYIEQGNSKGQSPNIAPYSPLIRIAEEEQRQMDQRNQQAPLPPGFFGSSQMQSSPSNQFPGNQGTAAGQGGNILKSQLVLTPNHKD